MEALKYRHELKHEINMSDYYTLRARLGAVMRQDANGGADGRYHVRSLYFDNDNDLVLKAKLDGLPSKEKYRVRIYNGNERLIRLERKIKRHGLCAKQSVELSRALYEAILSGEMDVVLRLNDPLLMRFYADVVGQRLRPRTLVDYYREAYTFPFGNVRVTFDSDIRSGLYAVDLFNGQTPMVPVGETGTMILEIKYDEFLPDIIRDIVQMESRHTLTYSKYASARIYG